MLTGKPSPFNGEFEAALRRELAGLLEGPAPCGGFEALELAVRGRVLHLAARALERWLNDDISDGLPSVPCACGGKARFAGRRSKRFTTILGTIELKRSYFHCRLCGRGLCPRDRALGLDESLSPAAYRMVGTVGALVSFQEGSDLLRELAGLDLDAKHVERSAETLGLEIAKDERNCDLDLDLDLDAAAAVASTLYLGMDGTAVPVRASEAADGGDGAQITSREAKLCTVWSAESRGKDGLPIRDKGSVTYTAAIESAAARPALAGVEASGEALSNFAGRVQREATRRRFFQAQRRVVLADGAPWIWKLASRLFPDAVQIVDRFHVKEQISGVARAVFGDTSERARAWAACRHAELDAGDLEALHKELARLAVWDEARRCADFVQRNSDRMRYARFHAEGLCTSSGVVEAGCKVAIGNRLKRSAMHWTVRGANAVIALRCCVLSGRFEAFWRRRRRRAR